jgi:hypothetical protein
LSGVTDILARKAATDDINSFHKCGGIESSHVIVNRNVWPMLAQNSLAICVDFAKSDCAESTCALESKRKASYTAEKV